MSILTLLTTTNIPERRWFIVLQDYVIFVLLFVSGPVGLFVNLWTNHSLTCAPVLDCAEKPNATDCANSAAQRIVREIPLPLTTYLSDACMEHTSLPPYVLYAYVPLFFGAVAVWLLHKLWLLLPPYSRIAKLYGGLDREKRRRIPARVLKSVTERSSTTVSSTGDIESQTLLQTPKTPVTTHPETPETKPPADVDGSSCSACIPSCNRKEKNGLPPGVSKERVDDRINKIDDEIITEVSPRERKVTDALVHLLYSRCRPKFHRLVLLLDFLSIVLCVTGGFLIVFCVIRVEGEPVKCTVTDLPLNRTELEYTSISCVIHNEVGARTLYVSCVICAFAIALTKLLSLVYYSFTICSGCFKREGNDCAYCIERTYCCGENCWNEGCWADCCLCCGAMFCYSFCLQCSKCCSCCEQDVDMDAEMLRRLLDVNDLDIDKEVGPVTVDVQNTQSSEKMAKFVMDVVNKALPVPNQASDVIQREIQCRLAQAYRQDMLSILDCTVPDKERVIERIATAYRLDLDKAWNGKVKARVKVEEAINACLNGEVNAQVKVEEAIEASLNVKTNARVEVEEAIEACMKQIVKAIGNRSKDREVSGELSTAERGVVVPTAPFPASETAAERRNLSPQGDDESRTGNEGVVPEPVRELPTDPNSTDHP